MDCDGLTTEPCQTGRLNQAGVQAVIKNLSSVVSFLLTPAVGSMAEVFGRRPLLILTPVIPFGTCLFYLLRHLFGLTYYAQIIWDVATAFKMSVVYAYMSDVIPPSRLPVAYGVVAVAEIIPDMVGAQVSTNIGRDVSFWSTTICAGVAVVWAMLTLPESLPADQKQTFEWRKHANPAYCLTILVRYKLFTMIGLLIFISEFINGGAEEVLGLVGTVTLGMSAQDFANLTTTVAAVAIGSVVFVPPIATRYFKTRHILMVVFFLMSFGVIMMSAASTTQGLLTLWFGWLQIGACAIVLLELLMSKHVSMTEQGMTFGAITALSGFGQSLGQLVMMPFELYWAPPPGFPPSPYNMYYLPAILMALLLWICVAMVWHLEEPSQEEKKAAARQASARKLREQALHKLESPEGESAAM